MIPFSPLSPKHPSCIQQFLLTISIFKGSHEGATSFFDDSCGKCYCMGERPNLYTSSLYPYKLVLGKPWRIRAGWLGGRGSRLRGGQGSSIEVEMEAHVTLGFVLSVI